MTQSPQLDLGRRIERISLGRDPDSPKQTVHISHCERLAAFCSHSCWSHAEAEIAETIGLNATYPSSSLVTPCCLCGQPISRTSDYVCFAISEMAYADDDLDTAHCLDDHDWAVVCIDCENGNQSVQREGLAKRLEFTS